MSVQEKKGPSRSVARPVANLGNTCYISAVLQVLSHAPELCLAMDCEPHSHKCPVAANNASKRRASSPSSSPDDAGKEPRTGTRKSRRSGRKSPQEQGDEGPDLSYCVLCELENHIRQVHDSSKKDKPFAPSTFVNGFIEHVAPWFQLGVQEDSHEFLRLLIEGMQKSARKARAQDNPQDDTKSGLNNDTPDSNTTGDNEYPFSLFRGMVESNVTCDSCKASSSTLDPIEDVGLEVTPEMTAEAPNPSDRPSRNSSPLPVSTLADVQTALQRFARVEALDSGYKCEKCGKVGRASKQSRLASVPPILTLHLKRFRYGDSRTVPAATGVAPGRRARSEVTQLLGNQADYLVGKSGSAKIEGHVKFDSVFDLKPYLTSDLQKSQVPMFCRLFAVIVHAGKNSHSGHYIAYVRSLTSKEWFKMDDGRVSQVSEAEVLLSEAYMLFYRVMRHPVAAKLEAKKLLVEQERAEKVANRKRRAPPFGNGEEWARAKTRLPPHLLALVRKAQELIADDIHLSSECFKRITKEASSEGAEIGKGPSPDCVHGTY